MSVFAPTSIAASKAAILSTGVTQLFRNFLRTTRANSKILSLSSGGRKIAVPITFLFRIKTTEVSRQYLIPQESPLRSRARKVSKVSSNKSECKEYTSRSKTRDSRRAQKSSGSLLRSLNLATTRATSLYKELRFASYA